jgi:hypothetical protein
MARQHDLARVVVVGDCADFPFSGGRGYFLRQLQVGTEKRCHCANANRHSGLHRLTAQLQQPGGRSEIERTCRSKC